MAIIGTCSLCGGRVTVPDVWMGIYPPTPQCESCHAVAADSGPVIKMKPPQQTPRMITFDKTKIPPGFDFGSKSESDQ